MGTVRFEDDPPFELKLAKPGSAYASQATVWLTLPVFELGPQRRVQQIQIQMESGHALALAKELRQAGGEADLHAIVVCLALVFAFASDSYGQSRKQPSHGNGPSERSAQAPAADQRGTDQMPLTVKVLPSPDAKEKAEQEKRETAEKTENDRRLIAETKRIADYTFWLSIFTVALFCAAIGQIVVFYIQLRYMGAQLRYARRGVVDAAIAANAAKTTAEVASESVEHIPRVERAYLFLGLDVKSHIAIRQPYLPDTQSHVEFGFKNHGKTPAIIEELHVMAGFWGASWPAMETAIKMVILKGWAVSAGETQGEYRTEFSLREDEVRRAREGKGYILFWGKILYRDVFKNVHESGWCRAYDFEAEGWRFAGDETLNYYT